MAAEAPQGSQAGRLGWMNTYQCAVGVIYCVHLLALTAFLPPTKFFDSTPILAIDYSHHWHYAYIADQSARQGRAPWGYDPSTLPGQWIDLSVDSSRPYELLALFVGPTLAIKLYLWAAILLAPLCVYGGCRALGLSLESCTWVLCATVVTIWLTRANTFMLTDGLVAFFGATYLAFLSFAIFCNFAFVPTVRGFLWFLLTASLSFCLHPFAPVLIVVPLVLVTFMSKPLGIRWRCLAIISPLIIAGGNGFWLIPMMTVTCFGSHSPEASVHPMILKGNMLFDDWQEFVQFVTQPHQLFGNLVGIALAIYGATQVVPSDRKVTRLALVAAWLTLMVLYWCGSFLPVVRLLQPNRFGMPYRLFLLVLAVPGCVEVFRRLRVPVHATAVVALGGIVTLAALTGRILALPTNPENHELITYLRNHTTSEDRIAIQMENDADFRTLALAAYLDREILSTGYPNWNDPIQFTGSWTVPQEMAQLLLGRRVGEWTPTELRTALERFGISIVLIRYDKWTIIMETIAGASVAKVGPYLAYRLTPRSNRFLIGSGTIMTGINQIRLTHLSPVNGQLVLKYRYHPGWKAAGQCQVQSYPISEDRYGFIQLVDPPVELSLTFDPWSALFAEWPPSGPTHR